MIKVFIPLMPEFKIYKDECRKLYESLQDKICDPNSFEFITSKTFFYLFTAEEELIGGIYYFRDLDGRLFLNGFSKRKTHLLNLECLKMSTDWFNEDIYALAQNKCSALCLLKCGFKKIGANEFVLIKKFKNGASLRKGNL